MAISGIEQFSTQINEMAPNIMGPAKGGNIAGELMKAAKSGGVSDPALLNQLKEAATSEKLQKAGSVTGGEFRGIGATGNAPSFDQVIGQFTNAVDRTQKVKETEVRKVLMGESDSIHRAMIAQREAQLHLKLMVEVRNTLVDGYNELLRMQV